MKKQTYFCTRPQLAGRLIQEGEKAEEVYNVFRPDLKAWSFPITSKVITLVTDYYVSIGEPVPEKIRRAGGNT